MRRMVLLIVVICFQFSTILAQDTQTDPAALKELINKTADLELQAAVTNYTYDLFLQQGEGRIGEEKFLISLMELINQEMAFRLKDPKEARQRYFDSLEQKLNDLYEFQQRLHRAGIRDLDNFSNELSSRIKQTIEDGIVDFEKKKVFEDALQMLYVSEEMIKLDQLQSNPELVQQLNQSRDELMAAFGDVAAGDTQNLPINKQPTIYDLFVSWKQTEEVQYERRLVDVKLIRQNFINNSSREDILRMFNRELDLAYTMFNYGDFVLSELLLSDILDTYPQHGFENLDDLYFYLAESRFANDQLLHARDAYLSLIKEYPGSAFAPNAYHRLVQLSYSLKNFADVIEYGSFSQTVSSIDDPSFVDVPFLLAMSYYELNENNKAIDIWMNMPVTSPYFQISRYFMGNASIEAGQIEQGIQTFQSIVNDNSSPAHLRNRAYYKLGLTEYQQKNYDAAINYLNLVALNFERYDKILNALAWSYLEKERSKNIGETRDFSQARVYANRLLAEYYASPYRMEATGLLAYINQIMEEPTTAISMYREMYQEKQNKRPIDEYLNEQEQLQALLLQAVGMKEKALRHNDREAYLKASTVADRLQKEIQNQDLAESSPAGTAMYREAETVVRQIKEANQLRLMAEESGNIAVVERLDSLQVRLTAVLESFPPEIYNPSGFVNYFDDFPVGKYVAEKQHQYDLMLEQYDAINSELGRIDSLVTVTDNRIATAKSERNFAKISQLEMKRRNLVQLRKKYDELFVAVNESDVAPNPYPEFDRWGDLGAFGIISVYFDQKRAMQGELTQVSSVLDEVNQSIDQRKQVIEDKIKKIEAEIRLMTMRARMEERARLRAERERAFKESYFDTRESEAPEEENNQQQ